MRTKNPGLALLERKIDEHGLRSQVKDELAQIMIEHKIAKLRKKRKLTQAGLTLGCESADDRADRIGHAR